jgi:hypothetical protein
MMSSLPIALLWGATLILPAAILFYWLGGGYLDIYIKDVYFVVPKLLVAGTAWLIGAIPAFWLTLQLLKSRS